MSDQKDTLILKEEAMKNRRSLFNFLRGLWISRFLNLAYVIGVVVAVVAFVISESSEVSKDSEDKMHPQNSHNIRSTFYIQILNTETDTNYKKHTALSPEESMKWLEGKGFSVEKRGENRYNIICRCRNNCVKLDITGIMLKIEIDSIAFIVFTNSENELRVLLL